MKARTKRILIYVAVIGFALFSVWASRDSANKANQNSADLQAGLIESCEVNGNPLRVTVQGLLHEQIASARKTPASFFPDIPPATFHRLIRESIEAKRKRLAKINPVDCAAQYRGSR